jgi:hypothetical protein
LDSGGRGLTPRRADGLIRPPASGTGDALQNDRTGTYRQLLADVRAEIAAARPRLEAALRDLSGLEDQERHLAALCGEVLESSGASEGAANPSTERPSASAPKEKRAAGTERPPGRREASETFAAGVRRVAREAIRGAGRPLNRAEIFEAVGQAGIRLPDRNAAKKISKILSADEGLENVRGEGYSVRF